MSKLNKKLLSHFKKLINDKQYRYDEKQLILPINYWKNQLELKSVIFPLNFELKSLNLDSKCYQCNHIIDHSNLLKSIPKTFGFVLAHVNLPKEMSHIPSPTESKWLVLDRISDPKNLGILMSTATLFNWDHIFIINGSCDPLNHRVIESSFGNVLKLKWSVIEYDQLATKIKEQQFNLIVSEKPPHSNETQPILFNRRTKEIGKDQLNGSKIALVMGSEHHGISENISTELGLGIPIDSRLESMNVASAGAILMDYLDQLHSSKN